MDENERLWQRFTRTGRVADYLHYRGIELPGVAAGVGEERTFGQRDQAAPDYRGADFAGISQHRGE